jgi:hypothetical protein
MIRIDYDVIARAVGFLAIPYCAPKEVAQHILTGILGALRAR